MHAWLRDAARALARATGVPADSLRLTSRESQALLDVAGRAAHESGARLNAPLLCYLLGRASAESGLTLAEVIEALAPEAAYSVKR